MAIRELLKNSTSVCFYWYLYYAFTSIWF
jgi:hypothetical protein